MRAQMPLWNLLMDHYFRMEIDGWDRLPAEPSLLIGVHSGGSLTMDAWTVALQWYRRFGNERILHGTAHDLLMAAPGLGDYFRASAVIPPTVTAMKAAFEVGHDVVLWPGGEQDAMRNWRKRDKAVLAGRKGFVRFALRQQVPIVPVATVGGHDTVFVLSEGRFLAKWTGLGQAPSRRDHADHRRRPIPAGDRNPADAHSAAGQDPDRTARPDPRGQRSREGQRRRVRRRRLQPGPGIDPGWHGPTGTSAERSPVFG